MHGTAMPLPITFAFPSATCYTRRADAASLYCCSAILITALVLSFGCRRFVGSLRDFGTQGVRVFFSLHGTVHNVDGRRVATIGILQDCLVRVAPSAISLTIQRIP